MEPLHLRYRPERLEELIGQAHATLPLLKLGKEGRLPHALLISGPSGCGKTSLARILRRRLKCSDADYTELDGASDRGIDAIRELQQRCRLSPLDGETIVVTLDECHQLTAEAQNAMLKVLEEPPKHVYFVLLTTVPEKILPTVKSRCHRVELRALGAQELDQLLKAVCKTEKLNLDVDVRDALVEAASGNARTLLVLLEGIAELTTQEDQLEALRQTANPAESIELARVLLHGYWEDARQVLARLEASPESVRNIVLAYMRTVLLNPRSGQAQQDRSADIIHVFSGPPLVTPPLLAALCWRLFLSE